MEFGFNCTTLSGTDSASSMRYISGSVRRTCYPCLRAVTVSTGRVHGHRRRSGRNSGDEKVDSGGLARGEGRVHPGDGSGEMKNEFFARNGV